MRTDHAPPPADVTVELDLSAIGVAVASLALHEPAALGGLRSYDLVLRYGGDEFVCALPHAGVTQAESRLQQVAGLLDDACPGARLSAGFAVLQPGQSADDVVQVADQDMYARRRRLRAVPPD